jgi:membrane protease YdiL (CAAX protease family)
VIATYALLTTAVLSLWLGSHDASWRRRFFWILPFVGAVIAGLASGILQPMALVWITAFAVATYSFGVGATARWSRTIAAAAVIVLSAELMAHQLGGFNNPQIISNAKFSPNAIPFRLHLNFDKTLVGIFILGFCHARIVHAAQWRAMVIRGWPITAGMIMLLLALSLATGYVRFDPKFPRESWMWMGVNLCFTCVAEEALFRGFVQAQLQRLWRNVLHGEWFALFVAAVLFGFAHAAGGPAYVALATVAGAGYGWAYLRTGRIEASILTHFALNATHFFFFTYPALQRAN